MPQDAGRKSPPLREERFVYPMGVVERLTGLTRRRIRYYEKNGLLHPSRTEGGQRLYSPENVELLLRIKAVMDSGISTLEAVKRMLASGLDQPIQKDQRWQSGTGARLTPWATWSEAGGDAAVRVVRQVPAPPGSPETDSPSYFRRVDVLGSTEKKRRNAE